MQNRRLLSPLLLLLLGMSVSGCAASGDIQPGHSASIHEGAAVFTVGPGAYPAAFAAAKDELRNLGFELARVDAHEGVIETRPQQSSGFATPWIQQESTLFQELENIANHQRRRVRVRFSLQEDADAVVGTRWQDSVLEGRVEVVVERLHRRGVRPDSASIRLSSVAVDPLVLGSGQREGLPHHGGGGGSSGGGSVVVSYSKDFPLVRRISARVRRAVLSNKP